MSLNEVFDIFNDEMQKIGTASREDAHKLGLWHQTFHCWIISKSDTGSWNLLFQLRHKDKDTFPELLDISCAGHLLTGESVEDGIRELDEELGINVSYQEIYPCGIFAVENVISENLMDREFCHIFLHVCNKPLVDYTFQFSEITGLFLINIDDFMELVNGKRDSVLSEALVLDKDIDGRTYRVKREVRLSDIVPHPKEYYDFILRKIQTYIE
jgi:isopentenyldiphosphate isomerase